jgi:class 3 adenylate cyclase/CheY-like chemotaxis protein
VRTPPRILAVDDVPANLDILRVRLESQGYEVFTAVDGEDALARVAELEPDLILLDIMMPKLDGIEVAKRLKQDAARRFIPIILVTAKADTKDVVVGLEAGGDDYLTKPFEHAALMARVRSLLRIKQLHDTVSDQAQLLQNKTTELADLNSSLEQRVAEQTAEIERISQLQRFLAPQVAETMSASEEHAALVSHRREITVLFCDLRGFTAFTESSDPEEVMTVLSEYHEAVGKLIFRHEGTLERFLGDGIMIIFNDPIPIPDHCERAVQLALDMRESVGALSAKWRKAGHDVGFGIGIATGYATLGLIGFDKRREYTAIGRVTNLASRLCDEAKDGQIVIAQRTCTAIQQQAEIEDLGELSLKGLNRPIPAYHVVGWKADQSASGATAQTGKGLPA